VTKLTDSVALAEVPPVRVELLVRQDARVVQRPARVSRQRRIRQMPVTPASAAVVLRPSRDRSAWWAISLRGGSAGRLRAGLDGGGSGRSWARTELLAAVKVSLTRSRKAPVEAVIRSPANSQ